MRVCVYVSGGNYVDYERRRKTEVGIIMVVRQGTENGKGPCVDSRKVCKVRIGPGAIKPWLRVK